MVNTILSSYPDGRQAGVEYVAQLVKAIAVLSKEEKDWVIDRREGIVSRCPKFLPTVGEVMELVRERHEAKARYRPTTSGYRKLTDEPDPWSPEEQDPAYRKRVVRQHWPKEEQPKAKRGPLVPPTTEDLQRAAALLRLKAPAQSDASPFLLRLLRDQQEEERT